MNTTIVSIKNSQLANLERAKQMLAEPRIAVLYLGHLIARQVSKANLGGRI
jgi:hypothetical protein